MRAFSHILMIIIPFNRQTNKKRVPLMKKGTRFIISNLNQRLSIDLIHNLSLFTDRFHMNKFEKFVNKIWVKV